jgi:hypothetical protein
VIVKEFKDSEGRPWRLALTCGSAARIRDMISVPGEDGKPRPFDLVDAKTLAESIAMIRTSPILLSEVLYAALMPDVDAKQMNREAFLAGMSGDSLDAGREALESEIVSFSPGRLRGVVSSLLAMMDDLEAKEAAKIKDSIEAMKSGVGTTSTSSPASSESIPPSGRSENLLAQSGG